MPDAPRYWSPAFIEAFVEAVNDDAAFQQTARNFSDTIILRCLGTPSGEDVSASYTFEKGQITNVDVWIEAAPSADLRSDPFDPKEAMARATAPYEIWKKLDQGEMNPMQALVSPDYKIEGPKLKILSNMGVFNGMGDVAARVDKTY